MKAIVVYRHLPKARYVSSRFFISFFNDCNFSPYSQDFAQFSSHQSLSLLKAASSSLLARTTVT